MPRPMTQPLPLDLRNQSFRGLNCEGWNFLGRDVRGCDFRNAKLRGANFSRAIAGRSEEQIVINEKKIVIKVKTIGEILKTVSAVALALGGAILYAVVFKITFGTAFAVVFGIVVAVVLGITIKIAVSDFGVLADGYGIGVFILIFFALQLALMGAGFVAEAIQEFGEGNTQSGESAIIAALSFLTGALFYACMAFLAFWESWERVQTFRKDTGFIGTDFKGADLQGVDFSHATLNNCNFKRANTRDINWSHVKGDCSWRSPQASQRQP